MLGYLMQQGSQWIEFLLINSIYAVSLAVMVLIARLLFPRLPKRIEYGLWCIVLLRLILPNDLSFNYAVSGYVATWLSSFETSQGIAYNLLSSASIDSGQLTNGEKATVSWLGPLSIIWLSIVSIVLVTYLVIRFKLLRMINQSHPIVEYPIVACANRWRLNFWVKQSVHVIAQDKYLSPFTFFFKNPIIFIPRKILASADDTLIESIIAHEMAHVKRRDSLWLGVQNVIQILYFFNPMVWLVVRRLSALRESLCDEMVLSNRQIEPTDYGCSLLKVLRFNINGEIETRLSNAFLGYKGQIKRRIRDIGAYTGGPSRPRLELALVGLYAIFFLPFLQQPKISLALPDTPVLAATVDESPFPKHLAAQVKLPKSNKKP